MNKHKSLIQWSTDNKYYILFSYILSEIWTIISNIEIKHLKNNFILLQDKCISILVNLDISLKADFSLQSDYGDFYRKVELILFVFRFKLFITNISTWSDINITCLFL